MISLFPVDNEKYTESKYYTTRVVYVFLLLSFFCPDRCGWRRLLTIHLCAAYKFCGHYIGKATLRTIIECILHSKCLFTVYFRSFNVFIYYSKPFYT